MNEELEQLYDWVRSLSDRVAALEKYNVTANKEKQSEKAK